MKAPQFVNEVILPVMNEVIITSRVLEFSEWPRSEPLAPGSPESQGTSGCDSYSQGSNYTLTLGRGRGGLQKNWLRSGQCALPVPWGWGQRRWQPEGAATAATRAALKGTS